MFWGIFDKKKEKVEVSEDSRIITIPASKELVITEEFKPEIKPEKKFNELIIKEMMVNKKVSREEAIRILSNPSK